jgi:hypothetical protein
MKNLQMKKDMFNKIVILSVSNVIIQTLPWPNSPETNRM